MISIRNLLETVYSDVSDRLKSLFFISNFFYCNNKAQGLIITHVIAWKRTKTWNITLWDLIHENGMTILRFLSGVKTQNIPFLKMYSRFEYGSYFLTINHCPKNGTWMGVQVNTVGLLAK